jgi:integrase
MGKRKGQRAGYLRIEHGSWLLTYRVYEPGGKSHRETVKIGPADGSGKLSAKQAERFAWDHYLSKIDETVQRPRSMMSVGEFWTGHFRPTAALRLKKSTRDQYFSLYQCWIGPVLGEKRLAILDVEDVETVISRAIEKGMAPATARHIRKVISAIWTRAKKLRVASGDNPAGLADMPAPCPVRPKVALSAEQMRAVLSSLPEPVRTMALTAVLSSANISELAGLRWKHINLTPEWTVIDGDGLAPFTMAIRQHFTRGEVGTLKSGSRRRNVPLPEALVAAVAHLKQRPKFTGPEDVVFAGRSGTPVNQNNVRARLFARVAQDLGLTRLSWHVFRYSHATFTESTGMGARDRQALMGHGSLEMTDRYTAEDQDRMRRGLDKVARLILDFPKERVQ